jgi:hypothetical protein
VLVAGIGLALLAVFIASRETPPECCADATCTHPLSRSKAGRWISFLILVLPVSIAAWLSPETFSKQAFEQRGITTDATGLGERRASAAGATATRGTSPASRAALETPQTQAPVSNAAPATVNPVSGPATPESPAPAPVPPAAPTAEATVPAAAPAAAPTDASKPAEGAAPANPGAPAAAAPAEKPAANPAAVPEYLQRTPEGYIVAEVLDMLYSVQDSQLRKDFEGSTVQLIAQIMPEKTAEGRPPRFKAVRMFMTCCAADARPVATLVEAATLPEVPEMTWVKIIGKATFPVENGKRTAVIQATSVQQTKPPEETMLY